MSPINIEEVTSVFCGGALDSAQILMLLVLQMLVAGFSAYTDISRAHEVANEVRRVSKQLKESQQLAQLYNNRERLFGMPVTNVSAAQALSPSTLRTVYHRRSTATCSQAQGQHGEA